MRKPRALLCPLTYRSAEWGAEAALQSGREDLGNLPHVVRFHADYQLLVWLHATRSGYARDPPDRQRAFCRASSLPADGEPSGFSPFAVWLPFFYSRLTVEFIADPTMRPLAQRVIRAYPNLLGHIDIDRLLFYHEITGCASNAVAKCRRIVPPYRDILRAAGIDADWIIEFYSVHTDGKSTNYLQVLMLHELLHIGEDGKIVKHNIQDFRSVLKLAGIDWGYDQDVPDITRKKIRLRVQRG
jgi:predicted metallopeptidase